MTAQTDATPSAAARALIAATLQRIAEQGADLASAVHDAVVANAPHGVAADPALMTEIERSNNAIFAAWLLANVQRPGEPVDPVLNAGTLDFVRDIARRGLADETENYFRVGQSITSQHVMAAAFDVSSDPDVLREALSTMLRSASDYVDHTIAALREVAARERKLRAAGGESRRLDVASALLEGDETDSASASALLGFELERPLVGCVVWTDPSSGPDIHGLEQITRMLGEAAGVTSLLAVPASAASVWAWFVAGRPLDLAALRDLLRDTPTVRAAIGSVGTGVEGFRQAHIDAVHTQRVMHRMGNGVGLATFDEVRTVTLARGEEPAAAEYVAAILGPLASAPAELRATLRALVNSGFDTVAVAAQLGLHRNTVLGRQRRAEDLLLTPPTGRWIDIGLALELDWWLDTHPSPAPVGTM